MTNLTQRKMVPWDTHFFFLVNETNKLDTSRWNCSIWDVYFLRALMGNSRSGSLSPITKSSMEGIVNSSYLGSWFKGFWGMSQETRDKRECEGLDPSKCWTHQERPCISLTLLAKETANKKRFSRLGAYLRTTLEACKAPIGGHVFSKLMNIKLIISLAAKSVPAQQPLTC